LAVLTEIMRFTAPANLTGLPAISFPAGYDKGRLPIGMQAIGRPWEENLLFRLALAERIVERKEPRMNFEVLPGFRRTV
jgi:Asp-tRNA(Asn)/Glu-tRNA(Gln) amidotransferase A subunit family amidase